MMMFIRGIRDISRVGASFLEAYWVQCNAELNGNALAAHIALLVCIVMAVVVFRLSKDLGEETYAPEKKRRMALPGTARLARHIMKKR